MKNLIVTISLCVVSLLTWAQSQVTNSPIWKSSNKETNIYSVTAPKVPLFGLTDSSSGNGAITTIKTPRVKFSHLPSTSDTSKFNKVLVGKGDSLIWVPKSIISSGGIGTGAVNYVFQIDSATSLPSWKYRQKEFYPENYGAVGDGTTDDRIPIINCIKAANSNGGGTVVFTKTYKIASNLSCGTFSTLNNIEFMSPNGLGKLYFSDTAASTMQFCFTGNNIWMHNFTIQGGGSIRTERYNLLAITGNNIEVNNMEIYNSMYYGVVLGSYSSTTSSNIRFHNNYVHNTLRDGVHVLGYVNKYYIEDNFIYLTGDDGIGIGWQGSGVVSNGIVARNICKKTSRGISSMGLTYNNMFSFNIVDSTFFANYEVESETGDNIGTSFIGNIGTNAGTFTPTNYTAGNGYCYGFFVKATCTPGQSYGIKNLRLIGNKISKSRNMNYSFGALASGTFTGIEDLEFVGNTADSIAATGAGGTVPLGPGVSLAPTVAQYCNLYLNYLTGSTIINDNCLKYAYDDAIYTGGNNSTNIIEIMDNVFISPNVGAGTHYAINTNSGKYSISDNLTDLRSRSVTSNINFSGSTVLKNTNNTLSSNTNYITIAGSTAAPTITASGVSTNLNISMIPKNNGNLAINTGFNASTGLNIRNSTNGANATSRIQIYNDNLSDSTVIGQASRSFTTSGLMDANQSYMLSTTNMLIGNTVGSKAIIFTSGGTGTANEQMRIDENGVKINGLNVSGGVRKIVNSTYSVTNNTTLSNVTGLSAAITSGKSYQIQVVLYTTSNSASGVKAALSCGSTTSTLRYEGVNLDGGTTRSQIRATSFGTEVANATASVASTITITGSFVATSSGTLTVQFAQNVSGGTASNVLTGSYMNLIEF